MKTKSILAIASLGLLAVALTLWIRAARARQRSDAVLGQLQAQRSTLAGKLDEVERRRAAARWAEPAPVLASQSSVAGPSATPPSSIPAQPPAPKQTRNDRMASDPEAQALWLQRARAKAALTYGEFFQRRNLSEAQRERFLEHKLRFEELSLDLEHTATPGDAAGKSAARTLRERGKAEYEAAQQASLGRENYEALLEYERADWVRKVVVTGFAGGAAVAGIPVTADQGDRLLQAALAATGGDVSARGEMLVRQIDWEMLDAQAQLILTPEQFTFFRSAAPPSGYASRRKYQIDAAAARAQQADAEKIPRSRGNKI